MNLLAIDSASSILSVSVSCGDKIFSEDTQSGVKHSELVMELIDRQMKKAGLVPGDLNGVLCMGGPGSFTGLRIAYSIAKGLALSLSIPFAPVPTLDCMAYPFRGSTVLAVMEAGKNTFYYAFYKDGNPQGIKDAPASQIDEEIGGKNESITLTGAGAATLYGSLSPVSKEKVKLDILNRGYSSEIISIAKEREILYDNNNAFLYSGPEYIRKTDAEINLQNTGS